MGVRHRLRGNRTEGTSRLGGASLPQATAATTLSQRHVATPLALRHTCQDLAADGVCRLCKATGNARRRFFSEPGHLALWLGARAASYHLAHHPDEQSGSMMTLSIICGFLPTLFVSPFAGVWADRYDRKVLIVLADSLIALCTLILAVLFLAGFKFVWLLFVASAIRSLGQESNACGSMILPQFVPQENLTKVNAINRTIQSSMTLLSPMLSATLLTVASIEAIFFIDVVTAAIAIAILLAFCAFLRPSVSAQRSMRATSGTCAPGLPTSPSTAI